MFPIPMNLIVYGVVVLTLFLSGFGIGHHLEAEKFDAYKAEVIAEGLAQAKLNEATITQYKQATQEATDETTKRNAAVHTFYHRLLTDTSSPTMSQTRETTRSTDGYSPNNLPPTSKLAEDCAITTVNLITLQEWAEKVTK